MINDDGIFYQKETQNSSTTSTILIIIILFAYGPGYAIVVSPLHLKVACWALAQEELIHAPSMVRFVFSLPCWLAFNPHHRHRGEGEVAERGWTLTRRTMGERL